MDVPWNEPFQRFASLYDEAKKALPLDYNAMTVATVDERRRPSARVCLLKGFDEKGFVFYTNKGSRKGQELLAAEAHAALCFYWPLMLPGRGGHLLRQVASAAFKGRVPEVVVQVRVEGPVAEVSPEESDAYFATRPRESQLGAWASLQSEPLESRELLERRVEESTRRFEGKTVTRPPHWGGFRVAPERMEFWKAHPHRLHWREEYARAGHLWVKRSLFP